MDFERQPPASRPDTMPNMPPQAPAEQPKKKGSKKKWLMWLLMLLLIGGAAYAGYWYADDQAKKDAKQHAVEVASLNAQIDQLNKDLAAAKVVHEATDEPMKPSEATLENIADAVESGNYAALQQNLAAKVTVTLAASEGLGDRTPAQVVTDMKTLDSCTDPWNFALPTATMEAYMDGDYEKYFPEDAHVGKSANDCVVSFTFNDEAKISGIFITKDADLL